MTTKRNQASRIHAFVTSQLHVDLPSENIREMLVEYGVHIDLVSAVVTVIELIKSHMRTGAPSTGIKTALVDRGINKALVNAVVDKLYAGESAPQIPQSRQDEEVLPMGGLDLDIEHNLSQSYQAYQRITDSAISQLLSGVSTNNIIKNLVDLGEKKSWVQSIVGFIVFVIKNLKSGVACKDIYENFSKKGLNAWSINNSFLFKVVMDRLCGNERSHNTVKDSNAEFFSFLDLPGFAHYDLFVVGDSHSWFWSGTEALVPQEYEKLRTRPFLPMASTLMPAHHCIPGVFTEHLGPLAIWNLIPGGIAARGRQRTLACVQAALSVGFRGWIMLSYGEIDIRCRIHKAAAKKGLVRAISECVDHYATFIHEIKKIHDKVAVFAPPGYSLQDSSATQLEKIYTTMFFIEMLKQQSGVPVLSLLPCLVCEEGYKKEPFIPNDSHLRQTMVPYALDLASKQIGFNLDGCDDVLVRLDITDVIKGNPFYTQMLHKVRKDLANV